MLGRPTWRFERLAWRAGFQNVAGLDECGRGCLAGPVVVAAVILDPKKAIKGINDSKCLTSRRREQLYFEIVERSRFWSVVFADSEEIDRSDILTTTIRAMGEAVRDIGVADYLLTDAVRLLGCGLPCVPLVKGDRRSFSIGAASILAKVSRDRWMVEADTRFPGYGFARHKGYGTALHWEALRRLGVSPLHRKSFRGVGEPPPYLPFPEALVRETGPENAG